MSFLTQNSIASTPGDGAPRCSAPSLVATLLPREPNIDLLQDLYFFENYFNLLLQFGELIALGNTCSCTTCSHPSGKCSGDCSTCLDQVHWGPKEGERVDYSCYKLLCNYVCKFADRYMENISKFLKICTLESFGTIDVFSIGCGATPDLMAFEKNDSFETINYLGVDRNGLWEPIHRKIENYCGTQHDTIIDLKRIDIFDSLKCINYNSYSPNLLVIQYLISHLYNTNQQDRIDELYKLIVKLVSNNKRSGRSSRFCF